MSDKIWDYTALNLFLTCRKRYYYRIVRSLVPKAISPALSFGKAVHDALNTYYSNERNLDEALKVFVREYHDPEGEELRTVENGIKMLKEYARVYKYEPFKVIGKPEVGFVIPLGDILWGGRIDLLVDWGGDLYVMEHKTTSILGPNFFRQFRMDMQVTSYVVGAEAILGRKCLGAIINALEPWKPLKRETARSKKPEDHFLRNPEPRTERLKQRFRETVPKIIREILRCEQEGNWWGTDCREVCHGFNSDCPYLQLCEYGEDERVIEKEYRVEEWIPYQQTKEEVKDEKGVDRNPTDRG